MNYKIYQVYYKEEQKKFLNPEFFPFDNTSNKRPDLLEYYIFHIGYKKAMFENLSHWGFVSWRWNEKCKIKSQEVIDFIDQNPNQDVYLMNWTPYYESVNWNVWDHGETSHPGIISITSQILNEMGYTSEILYEIMPRNVFCFSSYFVGSKKFWNDYIIFLKKFKTIIDSNKNLKFQVFQKQKYLNETELKYHNNYSFFPFIIERLFSTFLVINYDRYTICNYPYNFKLYEKYIGESYKDIQKYSDLKMKIWEDSKNFECKYSLLWDRKKIKNLVNNTHNLIPD